MIPFFQKYGQPPFNVVVLNGGPGVRGQMAPVCEKIAKDRGVFEHLQASASVEGQIREVYDIITLHAAPRVHLIGFSWGAMLGYLFAAQYPDLVEKLILISSGVYEDKYAERIMDIRISRLNEKDKNRLRNLMDRLNQHPTDEDVQDNDAILSEIGKLCEKADAFDPLPPDTNKIDIRHAIYQGVWKDVLDLRNSGELLKAGTRILCPVTAIHGDYDPHPIEGVENPLSRVIKNFRFIVLKKCGHMPWIEKQAGDQFFDILNQELT